MNNNCIYIYYDAAGVPFYVGRGLKNRPKSHLSPSNLKLKKCKFFHSKLSGMIDRGEFFEIKILRKDISIIESVVAEEVLIKLIGRRDLNLGPLCNLTDGGEGPKNTIVSEETRKKLSKSSKGRKMPESAKIKIGNALRGRKHTIEQNENHSKTMTGRKLTQEHIEKMRIASTGKFVSEETREKLRKNQTGVKYSNTDNFKKAAKRRSSNKKITNKIKTTIESKSTVPVVQYDNDGFEKIWESQHKAHDSDPRIRRDRILQCCNGKMNTHLRYKWRFLTEKEKGLL